jgi:hypothetical protein
MNELLTQQAKKFTMTCKTSDLLEVLKFLKRAVPKTVIGKLYCCEITIKTNEVSFVVIGVTKILYCNATEPAKAAILLLQLYDIVKNIKTYETEIEIGMWEVRVGKVTVRACTFFFQNESILRSINLPINYSDDDIIRLPEQYTPEKLTFNNLDELIRETYEKVEKDNLGDVNFEIRVAEKISSGQLKLNLGDF